MECFCEWRSIKLCVECLRCHGRVLQPIADKLYVLHVHSTTVAVASGVIKVIRELNSAPGNISNASGLYSDDRTYVALGSPSGGAGGSFLRCSAEQPRSLLAAAPSVTWLKDGAQLVGDGVRVTINTSSSIVATSNRTASYVRIFNFRQSDAGVYQCVFYDTPSQGGEVITTRPYKVDTGT